MARELLMRLLGLLGPHNLNQLRQLTEDVEPRLKEVWPRSTKFERRCYELLRDALPDYLRPLFVFGYFTGVRLGELLAIRWNLVDWGLPSAGIQ